MKSIAKNVKIFRVVKIIAVILITALLAFVIADFIVDLNVRYVPDFEKIDLGRYDGLSAERVEALSEENFQTLFWQTGLGRDAINKIFETESDPLSVLKMHQYNFFNPPDYICSNLGFVTGEERLRDENGNRTDGFIIADIRNGDIFITQSTHTVGWRHGHAGIVIDERNGRTVEAVFKGHPSTIQHVSHWQTYPTFIQLRPKNRDIGEFAATYTYENLVGITYSLFAGLLPRFTPEVRTTQCAHLPWFAYMQFGYDISPSGIWPVTPRDITRSDYLEIVQIFGVHPERLW
jgi:uncharacterized protein YycO